MFILRSIISAELWVRVTWIDAERVTRDLIIVLCHRRKPLCTCCFIVLLLFSQTSAMQRDNAMTSGKMPQIDSCKRTNRDHPP